ncbi:G6PC2 phosphatase, partial [Neodrepanis coruscans]|nr:G6PC2 phosphatase [Neodrepanis coruscans]
SLKMDLLHSNGVLIIQHLQRDYRAYQDFLNFMSYVGDPRNIFSIYFPLWFQLNQVVGTKMIWVAVIGDWFNLIFKWILFGHRPYWWVQETMIYPNQSSPCLEQFPITCETGPGSPSGHAMGSSCVWYVMVTAALSYTVRWKDKLAVTLHRLTWSFLWSIFWIIQISVCISRVFIATHFPHQVILGVFAGNAAIFFNIFRNLKKMKYEKRQKIFVSAAHLAAPVIMEYFLDYPDQCVHLKSIHSNTFPSSSYSWSICCCKGKNSCKISFRILCVAASLATLQLYNFVKIPTHTEYLFYVLSFCKSAAMPLTVVALVPYCVHSLMRTTEKKLN